jgi:alpha-glucosidase (family GH31 glycosyl hydrolase)
VTNNEAVEWFVNRLKKMQKDFGIDGFKFDGGESNFLDRTNNPAAFSNNATMFNKNYYSTKWIELANQFACGEVRTGYNSQSNHHLMRQWDKASIWGLDNGLESVITGALTFGVLGYPYVLPDMIGGNDWGQPPTKELMVRWAQANALLPSMQFSIPPWTFDGECAQLCLKAVEWHQKYADLIVQLAKEATETGWPIVRPMFWLAPNDKKTYTIGDQFVLGDKVIVAPIVKQGQFLRYVYLPFPNKSWKEVSSGSVFQGGDWHTITATLDHLPIFVLAKDEDVKLFKDQQAAKSAAYIKNQKIPDVPQTGASKTVL